MRSLGTLGCSEFCIWDDHESLGIRGGAVIGRKMALKHVHTLWILRPMDILHYRAKETLQMYLRLTDVITQRLSWIIWVSQYNHTSP